MAETIKSLRWWEGKTAVEIEAHYRKAEQDACRPRGSNGDGREGAEFTAGDFSRTPVTIGLSDADRDESQARMDAFFTKLAEWKKANKVRGKFIDTLVGMATLDTDDPSPTYLAEVLGVTENAARKRVALVKRYREVFQQIAREVGLTS